MNKFSRDIQKTAFKPKPESGRFISVLYSMYLCGSV